VYTEYSTFAINSISRDADARRIREISVRAYERLWLKARFWVQNHPEAIVTVR